LTLDELKNICKKNKIHFPVIVEGSVKFHISIGTAEHIIHFNPDTQKIKEFDSCLIERSLKRQNLLF